VSFVLDGFSFFPQLIDCPCAILKSLSTEQESTHSIRLCVYLFVITRTVIQRLAQKIRAFGNPPNRPPDKASGRICLSLLRINEHCRAGFKPLSLQIISLAFPRISVIEFPLVVTHAIPLRSARDPRT